MKKELRALILSAGLGSRLRPITNQVPKCLVKIQNIPILERWIRQLENIGCTHALINTHYKAEQVENYIGERQKTEIQLNLVYEKKLLGTAKTLIKNANFFKNCTCIMLHADNYTETDIQDALSAHYKREPECLLTMVTFQTDEPENSGIVITDKRGVMQQFFEKVQNPPGSKANGAIYIFESEFIEYIKNEISEAADFSLDVLPKLTGKIQTWETDRVFIDIGSHANLKKAREHARRSDSNN